MKTGLGIYKKYRSVLALFSLLRFELKKRLIGFDVANLYLQRMDKYALLLVLRKNGAQIGKNCDIETGLTFHNCKDYSNLIIGDNCHIGKQCFFDLKENIIIGERVTISMQCSFLTHTDVGKSKLIKHFPLKAMPIKIENDVYLGSRVMVLHGTTIGEHSLVAAGAIVNKSIKSYSSSKGVPAVVFKEFK